MSEFILGSGAAYEDSLLFHLIETNSVRPYVVTRQQAFQKVMNVFETLNGFKSTQVRADARQFKMPYIPQQTVYNVIKTGGRTAIGSLLRLEWADSSYDGFINNAMVKGSNGTYGIVVAHAPGYIDVKLHYSASGNTTFQSADFAAGTQVTSIQDVSAGVTDSRESIKYVPLEEYNVIGQQRYTLGLTREDLSRKTVVEVNGKPYWQHAAMSMFMKNTKNSIAMGIWDSPYVNKQDQWSSGGIKWQIENQGGQRETYDGTLTEDVLFNIASNARERGTGTTEYFVPCGANLLAGFQKSVGSKYIQYAGQENTIGGQEIKGLNVDTFKCLDISFKFLNWDVLNNPALNPDGTSELTGKLKASYTGVFLDTSPVQTEGYGEQPFITPYSYGPQSYGMTTIEGTCDMMGNYKKTGSNGINGAKVELEINELYQLNDPSKHVILEIAQ